MPRELRRENREVYACAGCGERLYVPQPKGLLGKFFHLACFRTIRRLSYGALNAEVIS